MCSYLRQFTFKIKISTVLSGMVTLVRKLVGEYKEGRGEEERILSFRQHQGHFCGGYLSSVEPICPGQRSTRLLRNQ